MFTVGVYIYVCPKVLIYFVEKVFDENKWSCWKSWRCHRKSTTLSFAPKAQPLNFSN